MNEDIISDIKKMDEGKAILFSFGLMLKLGITSFCKDGKAVLCGPNNSYWKTTVKIFRIVKWAYIEDLIPNMEDKA